MYISVEKLTGGLGRFNPPWKINDPLWLSTKKMVGGSIFDPPWTSPR